MTNEYPETLSLNASNNSPSELARNNVLCSFRVPLFETNLRPLISSECKMTVTLNDEQDEYDTYVHPDNALPHPEAITDDLRMRLVHLLRSKLKFLVISGWCVQFSAIGVALHAFLLRLARDGFQSRTKGYALVPNDNNRVTFELDDYGTKGDVEIATITEN